MIYVASCQICDDGVHGKVQREDIEQSVQEIRLCDIGVGCVAWRWQVPRDLAIPKNKELYELYIYITELRLWLFVSSDTVSQFENSIPVVSYHCL